MKMFLLCYLALSFTGSKAQSLTGSLPTEIKQSDRYLFYLHGGVVQEQGINAISQYYGRYEYMAILDSLDNYGFQVISEVRPKGTTEEDYAAKVFLQIDTLLQAGVPASNVVVVGASLGAYITVETAHLVQNPQIRYVLIGLCSEYAIDYFYKYRNELYGHFLSIFEQSDNKGSCLDIFEEQPATTLFSEIGLDMGISHAFLFKPFDEWVVPMFEWINAQK